jgi:hypothetical protein
MSIALLCNCGTSYQLKDEMAGQAVRCPKCNEVLAVAGAAAASAPAAEAVFARDLYLLNQKHFSVSEKYVLTDEGGKPLLFLDRPAHLLRSLGTIVAGLAASGAVLVLTFALGEKLGDAGWAAFLAGSLLSFAAFAVIAFYLFPLRHLTIYDDEAMRSPKLVVRQLREFRWFKARYKVELPGGEQLAWLEKNYLYDILRKRWTIANPDGSLIGMAEEESIILALLRRFLGTLFGLLRINFVIYLGNRQRKVGEFNRRMTLFDKYALDLRADPQRLFDRRLAISLGAMLDTGERR